MNFIEERIGGGRKYHLELDDSEIMSMNLDRFDRMLIKECGASKSVSDKLLALECITRRIEQQSEMRK